MASSKDGPRTLARLYARETGGLLLGKAVSGAPFRTGHVYELQELLGEVFLGSLGVSALPTDEALWAMSEAERDAFFPVRPGMRVDQLVAQTQGRMWFTPEEWARRKP